MKAMLRPARWLLVCLLAGSCRQATPAESVGARTVRVVNNTLRERQLDTLAVGAPSAMGPWHLWLSPDTSVLVVAYPVVALGLPDGPFELLAPVTYFRFADANWMQYAPVRGTDTLPTIAHRSLEGQFTNRDYVYFYVVKRLVLDMGTVVTDSTMANAIRQTLSDVERNAKRLKSAPFIGGDAEP